MGASLPIPIPLLTTIYFRLFISFPVSYFSIYLVKGPWLYQPSPFYSLPIGSKLFHHLPPLYLSPSVLIYISLTLPLFSL